jgi:putative ABC transport system permease protein
MIISVVIFYTFNSLLYIPEIQTVASDMKDTMSQTSVVLIGFIIVFIGYSNAFFTRKRKKEVGLYSLLGVRKKTIASMLFFENIILGALTLLSGLVLGVVLSKLSTMLLLKLLGASVSVSFSIPVETLITTSLVFAIITLCTSAQSALLIYRFKLIELFQADKKGETVPKASISLAVLSIVFLVGSYWLMFNEMAMLAMPFILVGTYLLFRTFTVYVLKRAQNNKTTYYKGINVIGTSHLLYRIKGNALMLTVIALLITVALPYLQAGFSEYTIAEKDARETAPFSYIHLSTNEVTDNQINRIISADKEHPISEQLSIPIIQTTGNTLAPFQDKDNLPVNLLSESTFNNIKNTLQLGDLPRLNDKQAVALKEYTNQPPSAFSGQIVTIPLPNKSYALELNKLEEKSVRLTFGPELLYLVINDQMFNDIASQVKPITYKAYKVEDEKTAVETSEALMKIAGEDTQLITFYEAYTQIKTLTGMKIFIVSALAFVLLVATGSVIYFKQLTEAHSDKKYYEILHKIGVSKKETRTTIVKQTLFVFSLPFIIGILNAGILTTSIVLQYKMDVSQNLISFITALAAFGVIYFIYYLLTVYSYNRIVNK